MKIKRKIRYAVAWLCLATIMSQAMAGFVYAEEAGKPKFKSNFVMNQSFANAVVSMDFSECGDQESYYRNQDNMDEVVLGIDDNEVLLRRYTGDFDYIDSLESLQIKFTKETINSIGEAITVDLEDCADVFAYLQRHAITQDGKCTIMEANSGNIHLGVFADVYGDYIYVPVVEFNSLIGKFETTSILKYKYFGGLRDQSLIYDEYPVKDGSDYPVKNLYTNVSDSLEETITDADAIASWCTDVCNRTDRNFCFSSYNAEADTVSIYGEWGMIPNIFATGDALSYMTRETGVRPIYDKILNYSKNNTITCKLCYSNGVEVSSTVDVQDTGSAVEYELVNGTYTSNAYWKYMLSDIYNSNLGNDEDANIVCKDGDTIYLDQNSSNVSLDYFLPAGTYLNSVYAGEPSHVLFNKADKSVQFTEQCISDKIYTKEDTEGNCLFCQSILKNIYEAGYKALLFSPDVGYSEKYYFIVKEGDRYSLYYDDYWQNDGAPASLLEYQERYLHEFLTGLVTNHQKIKLVKDISVNDIEYIEYGISYPSDCKPGPNELISLLGVENPAKYNTRCIVEYDGTYWDRFAQYSDLLDVSSYTYNYYCRVDTLNELDSWNSFVQNCGTDDAVDSQQIALNNNATYEVSYTIAETLDNLKQDTKLHTDSILGDNLYNEHDKIYSYGNYSTGLTQAPNLTRSITGVSSDDTFYLNKRNDSDLRKFYKVRFSDIKTKLSENEKAVILYGTSKLTPYVVQSDLAMDTYYDNFSSPGKKYLDNWKSFLNTVSDDDYVYSSIKPESTVDCESFYCYTPIGSYVATDDQENWIYVNGKYVSAYSCYYSSISSSKLVSSDTVVNIACTDTITYSFDINSSQDKSVTEEKIEAIIKNSIKNSYSCDCTLEKTESRITNDQVIDKSITLDTTGFYDRADYLLDNGFYINKTKFRFCYDSNDERSVTLYKSFSYKDRKCYRCFYKVCANPTEINDSNPLDFADPTTYSSYTDSKITEVNFNVIKQPSAQIGEYSNNNLKLDLTNSVNATKGKPTSLRIQLELPIGGTTQYFNGEVSTGSNYKRNESFTGGSDYRYALASEAGNYESNLTNLDTSQPTIRYLEYTYGNVVFCSVPDPITDVESTGNGSISWTKPLDEGFGATDGVTNQSDIIKVENYNVKVKERDSLDGVPSDKIIHFTSTGKPLDTITKEVPVKEADVNSEDTGFFQKIIDKLFGVIETKAAEGNVVYSTTTTETSLNLPEELLAEGGYYSVEITSVNCVGESDIEEVFIAVEDPLPTNTPTPTVTNTPIPTVTNTPTPTSTSTPTPTVTNTPTPTSTLAPTATLTSTLAPTSTCTPVPVSTATSTPLPTATPTMEPTATPTMEPTATPTMEPTVIPATEPTNTTTPEPTATLTPLPTSTPTPIPKGDCYLKANKEELVKGDQIWVDLVLTDVKADRIYGHLDYDTEVFELDEETLPILADNVELVTLDKDTGYVELKCEQPQYFMENSLISIPFIVLAEKEYTEFAMIDIAGESEAQPTLEKEYVDVNFSATLATPTPEPTATPTATSTPVPTIVATKDVPVVTSTPEPTEKPLEHLEIHKATATPKPTTTPKPTATPTLSPTPTAIPVVIEQPTSTGDVSVGLPKTGQDLARYYLARFGGATLGGVALGIIFYLLKKRRKNL